jgi:hypothetical protein
MLRAQTREIGVHRCMEGPKVRKEQERTRSIYSESLQMVYPKESGLVEVPSEAWFAIVSED